MRVLFYLGFLCLNGFEVKAARTASQNCVHTMKQKTTNELLST